MTLKIVDEAGATKTTSNCDGSLAAGNFCALIMPVGFVGPFACTRIAATRASVYSSKSTFICWRASALVARSAQAVRARELESRGRAAAKADMRRNLALLEQGDILDEEGGQHPLALALGGVRITPDRGEVDGEGEDLRAVLRVDGGAIGGALTLILRLRLGGGAQREHHSVLRIIGALVIFADLDCLALAR